MTPPPAVPPKQSPIKEAILRRIKVLYLLFLIAGLAIVGKIIWLQVGSEGEKLRNRSEQYSYRTEILEAARGNIYSDDGRLLATTIPYYELRMDMAAGSLTDEVFRAGVDSLSIQLSGFFKDRSPAQYRAELTAAHAEGKRYYLVNPRRINYLDLCAVRRFPLFRLGANKGGFIPIEVGRRVYPYGNLGKRTIGMVNTSGVRVGIEGGFDDVLKGINGVTVKQKVSGDFWTPISSPLNIDPIDGVDVVTTLNIELQDIAQTSLREQVLSTQSDWGCVVVMETSTGHIKAIANLTRKADGSLVEDYNYAIGMNIEPGSTFKTAGLLALLDDAQMPLSKLIDVEGGEIYIGHAKVVDSHKGYGVLTLQEIFEKSSNVGMAKAVNSAYAADPKRFVAALERMGIGRMLNLQIGGEVKPTLRHPGEKGWDGTTLTMMSYGYALRLAPIHTLTFYNAIANGGVMVKPLLVNELRQYGKTLSTIPADTLIPSICSPKALADIHTALEGVVIRGTGRSSLSNPKYRAAAKTGTAQIAIGRGGYMTAEGGRHYLGSLVGYFPADQPRYTVMVAMKTYYYPGSGKPYYGAELSGKLFRTIADRICTLSYNFQQTRSASAVTPYTPRLQALPGPAEGLNLLFDQLRIAGPAIDPSAGEVALDSGRVVAPKPLPLTAGTPDFRGLSLDEALHAAEAVGLRPRFVGLGLCTGQSIPAQTPFEAGTEITLTLGTK